MLVTYNLVHVLIVHTRQILYKEYIFLSIFSRKNSKNLSENFADSSFRLVAKFHSNKTTTRNKIIANISTFLFNILKNSFSKTDFYRALGVPLVIIIFYLDLIQTIYFFNV